MGGGEGREGRQGNGKQEAVGERRQGKRRDGSTWDICPGPPPEFLVTHWLRGKGRSQTLRYY